MNVVIKTFFLIIFFSSKILICGLTFPQELQEKILNNYIFNIRTDGILAAAFFYNKEPIENNPCHILSSMRILHRILTIRQVCITWSDMTYNENTKIEKFTHRLVLSLESVMKIKNKKKLFCSPKYEHYRILSQGNVEWKTNPATYTLALPTIFTLEKIPEDKNIFSNYQNIAHFVFNNLTEEISLDQYTKERIIKKDLNLSLNQFEIILSKSKHIVSLYKHHLVRDKTIEQGNRLYWDYTWLLIELIHHFKFAEKLISRDNVEKKYMLKYMYDFILKNTTKEYAYLFLMNWLWRGGFEGEEKYRKKMLQEIPMTIFSEIFTSNNRFRDFPTIYGRVLQANYSFLFDHISKINKEFGIEFFKKWFEHEWLQHEIGANTPPYTIKHKVDCIMFSVNHPCPLFVKINTKKTIYDHLCMIDNDENLKTKEKFSLRLPLLRKYLENMTDKIWEKDQEELEKNRDDIAKIKKLEPLRNIVIFAVFLLVFIDLCKKKP